MSDILLGFGETVFTRPGPVAFPALLYDRHFSSLESSVVLSPLLKPEWHSVERIAPPRPLIPKNCYCWTIAG